MKLVWVVCLAACGHDAETIAPAHSTAPAARAFAPPPPKLPDDDGSEDQRPDDLPPHEDVIVVQIDDAPVIYEGEDIPDTIDLCPDLPENVNGDDDVDGCPELVPAE